MDQISVDRASKLHPKLRSEVLAIMDEINKALTGRAMFRITFGLRTFAEQQAIYNQGRTTPGSIVTNAKPGQSYHNYGLALDFAFVIDGKTSSWDDTKDWDGDGMSDWREVVNIFEKHGWTWGGDFESIVDKPHFEKRFGYNWRALLDLHNRGKVDTEGYVII